MQKLNFPQPFLHEHPPVRNVNQLLDDELAIGHRAADFVAAVVGSWTFILVQSAVLSAWAILNVVAYVRHWDPYPFILMNLFLSMQAAYTAPIIMMSQNRQSLRDRFMAQEDYEINRKAEVEIRAVLDHLTAQDRALEEIYSVLAANSGAQKRT